MVKLPWWLRRRESMKTYQVWMKGMSKCVEVKAHDVGLEVDSDAPLTAFWNFMDDGGDDAVTLHAFPHADVAYIVSVE